LSGQIEEQARGRAAEAVRTLSERGRTAAVAESSTGGLIAHLLTEIPRASGVFLGGVIAYDNQLKERLGVRREILEAAGAVSAEAASAMAAGVRRYAAAGYGVAVTGIAGPSGSTPAKPAGLTYIAVASASGIAVEEYLWEGGRSENKMRSALAAIDLLIREAAKGG
jgi:nicotinamide-nucleotide amidase